jgi:hypothetical protein
MREELEKKLVEKYPNLYKKYGGDPRKTCMHWGIAVGDGWYDIVDRLSAELESFGIVAEQVKQKFGGLRFDVDYPHHLSREQIIKVREIKYKAEQEAYETCEVCGKLGKIRKGTWINVLCEECNKKD